MMNRTATLMLLISAATACAATVGRTEATAVASDDAAVDVAAAEGVIDSAIIDVPPPLPRLSVGTGVGRFVRRDGAVFLWGDQASTLDGETMYSGDAGIGLPRPAHRSSVPRMFLGADSFCHITDTRDSAGAFRCWGHNDVGQLGDGTSVSSLETGATIATVTDAASSGQSWCVVAAGGVRCWGAFGGQSPGPPGPFPVPIRIPAPIVRVFGGAAASHYLALDVNGTLWCWGDNHAGRPCGTDSDDVYPTAVRIPTIPGVRSAVLGNGFSCALSVGGDVRCWGNVPLGLSGEREGQSPRTLRVPTLAPAYSGATSLSAGLGFVCALMASGRVACGGSSLFNWVLGSHPVGLAPYPPQEVPGIEDVVELHTAITHSCALTADDSVYCWGYNDPHQLGFVAAISSPPRRLAFP